MSDTIRLSLISHTNVGKTTLARTLLRRDVGEVRDAAHVTDLAEGFPLIETSSGDVLELWDTPGFGDSIRLLRRLRREGSAIGWFLSQVWDRWLDRPFFSSQQAVRNVRDTADVVLYLANASEDEIGSAYVEAEVQILEWIGKPVLVLLNQLGRPRPAEAERADVERWTQRLAAHPIVRDVLAFDAFARCWVQEQALFERIAAALPAQRQDAFAKLAAAWTARNLQIFERSSALLARAIAATAQDRAQLARAALGERTRSWLRSLLVEAPRSDPAREAAMLELAERLDARLRDTTLELLALHGLSGEAIGEITRRLGADFRIHDPADVARSGVLGGLVSGALGGLTADLTAGGLTFGAGALIGAVLGAAGAGGLAHAYNLARGAEAGSVRWSDEFLAGRVAAALLRYLAIAHYGRGRGDFVESEYPPHWRGAVESLVAREALALRTLWNRPDAPDVGPADSTLDAALAVRIESMLRELLRSLYPQQSAVLGESKAVIVGPR